MRAPQATAQFLLGHEVRSKTACFVFGGQCRAWGMNCSLNFHSSKLPLDYARPKAWLRLHAHLDSPRNCEGPVVLPRMPPPSSVVVDQKGRWRCEPGFESFCQRARLNSPFQRIALGGIPCTNSSDQPFVVRGDSTTGHVTNHHKLNF